MSLDYDKPYYNKLYYPAVDLSLGDGITVNPRFTCPTCGTGWGPNLKISDVLPASLDINQRVTFKCPKCGIEIRLYVAFHRDAVVDRALCVSVEPIPSYWWMRPRP